ncbi:hypothetical protein DPMN_141051 [Dreissena polymorpha]|uniref:Uncharacterized protein n=1 Tax=Dreissena polymorpha TaxID=45954 RepID=A0A9D4JHY0_DREPO|nr:hypothetical protein DPMN_141051 [Dreissena polymorpha]
MFEKSTATYKEVNDFLNEVSGLSATDDMSFLDGEFDIEGETLPEPATVKRFQTANDVQVSRLKSQNTDRTTDKQPKWAGTMMKGKFR